MMPLDRTWIVLFVAAALVLPAGIAIAQPEDPGPPENPGSQGNQSADGNETADAGNESAEGNETADEDANESDDDGPPPFARNRSDAAGPGNESPGEQGRAQGEAMREQAPRRGLTTGLQEDDGTVTGEWVSFEIAEDLPGIQDHRVRNASALDSIALDTDANASWSINGASFQIQANESWVRVFGTPNALLLVKAPANGTATITVADGVTIEQVDLTDDQGDDDNSTDENETAENQTAEPQRSLYKLTLADNSTLYLAGTNLTSDGAGTFTLAGEDTAQLRLSRPATAERGGDGPRGEDGDQGPPAFAQGQGSRAMAMNDQARDRVEQAAASGQIGLEVFAQGGNESLAVETGKVRATQASTHAKGPVKATLAFEAPNGTPGTTVSMALSNEDLGNLTLDEIADRFGVRYDGESINSADDLDDVLDPTDDAGEAEYLLVVGAEEVLVLVSIPHFSPHTVEMYEIQSSNEDVENNQTPLPAWLALVGVSLAALVAGRHRC